MIIRVIFKDGTWIKLQSVQTIEQTGLNEFSIKCFGNDPAVRRDVIDIQIVSIY